MKKKKVINRVTFFWAIFIFIAAFVETLLYYDNEITNKLYLVFLCIFNGISVFGMDASIDIFDILQVEAGNVSVARSVLNNIYILCYFGAPLITVKCVANIIGYIVKEKLIDFNISICKKRILIVGYNEYVEKLIKSTLKKNKKEKFLKKRKILVLHKNDISEKLKFSFQMSGVSFQKYEKLDFDNESERKMFLKWMAPKKLKQIVLFEEKSMDNVSNYCFFLKCFEKDDKSKFQHGLQIDCNYDMPQVENLIWECYDRKRMKTNLKYKMSTFSIPMLRAQSVLRKEKIYDKIVKESDKDIHLLVVGFGKMGRRFLKRAINEGVVSEKNNIVVDIFEKDINKIKQYLTGVNQCYYGDENTIYIGPDVTEGSLKIRFHQVDVSEKQFVDYMEAVSKDNPFTYVAICVDNPEVSVTGMLCVENYLQHDADIPVLVRMDSGQQLKELETVFVNLKLVPGDDEILTLEHIHSDELERISEDIHKRDSEQRKNKVKFAYEIESQKYRVLHYEAKKAVYEQLSSKDKTRMKKIFSSPEYTEKEKRNEFIGRIKDDSLLFKFGAIEHRRWSYYVILNGWSYANVKNEQQKVTPYLCPFERNLNDDKLRKKIYYEYKDWNEIITKNDIGE